MTQVDASRELPELMTVLGDAEYTFPETEDLVMQLAERAIEYFDLAKSASEEPDRRLPSPYEAERYGSGGGLLEAIAVLAKPALPEELRIRQDESSLSMWNRIIYSERKRRQQTVNTKTPDRA